MERKTLKKIKTKSKERLENFKKIRKKNEEK